MGNEQSTQINEGPQTQVEEANTKHQNGGPNGYTVKIMENDVGCEVAAQQSSEAPTPALSLETVLDQTDHAKLPAAEDPPPVIEKVDQKQETPVAESDNTTPDQVKKDRKETTEKVNLFDKLFKKKTESPSSEENLNEAEIITENQSPPQVDDTQPEPAEVQEDTVTQKETNCVSASPTPEEVITPETGEDRNHLVETQEGESNIEENTVMNFFKTLVNPTKTPKKDKSTPDVVKDQEAPSAATTTAAQVIDAPAPAAPKAMSIPPPPPPEPPKLESKGDTAAKPVKGTQKEEPKEAAKEPEIPKGKKDSPFSKLFRPKALLGFKASRAKGGTTSEAKVQVKPTAVIDPILPQTAEVVPEPVEVEVDASKASTLEAAAKPEPPPVQEEKQPPPKKTTSPFKSFLKPSKVLLDQMAAKVQTASTSGVRLLMKTTGGAAEPKKEPSAPPAEPEAAQAVKAEEPKATPKAKPPEAPVDNQSVSETSQSGEDTANIPRKLEKRNSIHLFFKNLGKRHSDAGVQTEPVAAPEKTK